MKLIIKRKKVNNSNKSKTSMAKTRTKTKSSRRQTAKVFGGKILNFQVPLISRAFKNKTVQQVMAARGAVGVMDDVALLVNQPTLNQIQSNTFVRVAEAGAAGGTIGALVSLFRQGVLSTSGLSGIFGGGQQQQATQTSGGFA